MSSNSEKTHSSVKRLNYIKRPEVWAYVVTKFQKCKVFHVWWCDANVEATHYLVLIISYRTINCT